MPTYKLMYFPLRGRGEAIRYICHQAGVPFEDKMIMFDEWSEVKPKTVMGQLPMLEVDGKQLAQSMSIARYLANELGLSGSSTWEHALCDMYVDGVEDLNPQYAPVYRALFAKDETLKNETWEKFKQSSLGPFLDRYEKFLGENKSGWLVGAQVTWADLVLAEFMDRFVTVYEATVLDKHPNVKAHMMKVHALPNVKKYVQQRPKYVC